MYEVVDETAAQVLMALESGDSIRRVARRLDRPHETVRQAVNRLEDAGYVRYDDGLTVLDDRVRTEARNLVAASARFSPPSIAEAYFLPQFGDWPFAFTRVEGVPVIPGAETIEYMRKHSVHFQSALAMLDRMYDDLDLDVVYRESDPVVPIL